MKAIWWQVIPALVLDAADWPAKAASSGIPSFKAIQASIAAGHSVEALSNFFLVFSSHVMKDGSQQHSH